MIIRKITLSNFGIYGDEHEFDFTPKADGIFSRPIVLFIGKNGVGKTTLVEAIKLCLFGPLVVGDRVSQEEYDRYLIDHIFKPSDNNIEQSPCASITLTFDFVRNAKLISFQVQRSWHIKGKKVFKELSIMEDGKPVSDISIKDSENFLRELIPPVITDLFFFDGEKIRILADGNNSDFLANKIQALLGINLVKQLTKDIDIFITKQTGSNGFDVLQQNLIILNNTLIEREELREKKKSELTDIQSQILGKKSQITSQEQIIASEGGGYSSNLNELYIQRERLQIEIEFQRKKIQELCNDLMPFAIAPEMCQKVANRLNLEQKILEEEKSEIVLSEKINTLSSFLAGDEFWKSLNIEVTDSMKHIAITKITQNLKSLRIYDSNNSVIIHDFSDQDRFNILDWINDCQNNVPREFCINIEKINSLEEKLQHVLHNISLAPTNDILVPLVEEMSCLNQELGQLLHKEALINGEIGKIDFTIIQLQSQIRKNKEEIALSEKTNSRVSLALKSQEALEEYSHSLLLTKIKKIESVTVRHFNELCRKENLLSSITIDPNTFEVSLLKHSRPFERQYLSAGENQILAISFMWALREVSGLPMPVIIDTPLSRLDNEHRQNMANHFFPHVSHQVVLLATDAELTSPLLQDLETSISSAYIMEYDKHLGKTEVTYVENWNNRGVK